MKIIEIVEARVDLLYEVAELLGGLARLEKRRNDYPGLTYTASVSILQSIKQKLSAKYGKPSEDHALLNHIVWSTRDGRIHVEKADSMYDPHTLHNIYIMPKGD